MYSTPLVADLDADGEKEVLVTAGDCHVAALQHSGHAVPGWPVSVAGARCGMASPLLYDLDRDGTDEVVVTTQDAEIVFIT